MLIEQIINGLVLGSMYSLIALGYTLVFGVLDKLNFAHAELFMLGGFVALVSFALGAPLWAAITVALVFGGMAGLVVELVSFRRFIGQDAQIVASLSSLSLGLVFVDLVQKVWGTEAIELPIPADLRSAHFVLFGISFNWIKIGILGFSILLMFVMHQFVSRTRIGRNIRAVADSPTFAGLLGINVKRVNQQTFFIASALASVAGLLLAMRNGIVASDIGFSFGLKALAIMAIGGMGDLRGAMAGGLIVGVLEALAFEYGFGKLADILVWLLMMFVILMRPAGLFGAVQMREVRA